MKQANNPLRELAVPHQAFDGAVTFWMLPYANMEVDIRLRELAQIEPPEKWVNLKTGEEVYKDPMPNPFSDPIIDAQRDSQWEHIGLWGNAHNIFYGMVPLAMDIEFKGKDLPIAARGLKAYWDGRNGSTAHNWALFKQVIGGEAARAWVDAYASTQDTSMDGPEALQSEPSEDADPNA